MGAWIQGLELAGRVDAGIQENQIIWPGSGQVGQDVVKLGPARKIAANEFHRCLAGPRPIAVEHNDFVTVRLQPAYRCGTKSGAAAGHKSAFGWGRQSRLPV
jgi:hypothetical protein